MADDDLEPTNLNLFHLVLYQEWGQGQLDRSLARKISEQLDKRITTPPELTAIDLWIDSPGGDAHAAYKLFLDIRARCSCFRAVVPDYAKSAATLLVLGADEIYMGPSAELGPLDAQVEHPDREGKIVSALDAARAMNYLAQVASDLTLAAGPQFLHFTELPRADVLRELLKFMARFLEPVVAKLDPQLIHHAANDLRVAQEYAIRMLEARNLPEGKFPAPADIAESLVSQYPEHGFVISRSEAKLLGLPIQDGEGYHRWAKAKSLLTLLRTRIGGDLVEVMKDEDLDKEQLQNNENGKSDTDADAPKTIDNPKATAKAEQPVS